jgi:hypothetical protein
MYVHGTHDQTKVNAFALPFRSRFDHHKQCRFLLVVVVIIVFNYDTKVIII